MCWLFYLVNINVNTNTLGPVWSVLLTYYFLFNNIKTDKIDDTDSLQSRNKLPAFVINTHMVSNNSKLINIKLLR